jgi:hypothetical protein
MLGLDLTTALEDHYKAISETRFIVSPLGRGLDCYRTWEALLLGSWPIVQSSTLNSAYEGLPVLIVESWSDLTDDLLKRTKEKFESKRWEEWKWDTLFTEYWRAKFRGFII